HFFYKKKLYFIARAISQFSRFLTGIEIHPAAKIGRRYFIDHGTGVVIGETCEIGDDVTVFVGLTLGGTGTEKGKMQSTITDHALIATGAKVLGSFTIGEYSKVGAGAAELKDVPEDSTVGCIPGKVVRQHGKKVRATLDDQNMPDPVEERCIKLQ